MVVAKTGHPGAVVGEPSACAVGAWNEFPEGTLTSVTWADGRGTQRSAVDRRTCIMSGWH